MTTEPEPVFSEPPVGRGIEPCSDMGSGVLPREAESAAVWEPIKRWSLAQEGMPYPDAGSMHEPKPYTGDLDWSDHLHPFVD